MKKHLEAMTPKAKEYIKDLVNNDPASKKKGTPKKNNIFRQLCYKYNRARFEAFFEDPDLNELFFASYEFLEKTGRKPLKKGDSNKTKAINKKRKDRQGT